MPKRILVLMCSIFLIVPLLFMGCGSDGSDGSTGATGGLQDLRVPRDKISLPLSLSSPVQYVITIRP